jgi:amino acid permease
LVPKPFYNSDSISSINYLVNIISKFTSSLSSTIAKTAIMAGPVLNFTIFTKSIPHALRAISLATFAPAFLVLLIQGIVAEAVNPAIGILPLFFSSAFAALLLANEKKCGCQASGLTGTPIHLVFDLMLGIGLLVCLILDWVFLPGGGTDRGMVMLGTYGTNFLICNL